jgi:hypothetical protein
VRLPRTVGLAVLLLLGVGVLSRITDNAGAPPKNPDRVPVEIRAAEMPPATETVDLKNGNLHLQIPIRAAHRKATAPSSGH